jgi:hypothetical protein
MLDIMHALAKLQQYLVGGGFVVKSDHNSLKYLLEQKDLKERQQKWVSIIQAYEFDIEFVYGGQLEKLHRVPKETQEPPVDGLSKVGW